jgi:hypothetical protein
MRRTAFLTVLALVGLACGPAASENKADDAKGTEVDLDGLKATTPAEWKKETPPESFVPRWMQFRIPKAKDDKYDAELVIFKGLGGSADDNIARWKKQFIAPKGKSIDDVAKVTDVDIGGRKGKYLDVSGTFLYRDPANPRKEEEREDYRMLAIHYEGKDNTYHFRFYGPAKTVEEAKKGFDEWLKAFK